MMSMQSVQETSALMIKEIVEDAQKDTDELRNLHEEHSCSKASRIQEVQDPLANSRNSDARAFTDELKKLNKQATYTTRWMSKIHSACLYKIRILQNVTYNAIKILNQAQSDDETSGQSRIQVMCDWLRSEGQSHLQSGSEYYERKKFNKAITYFNASACIWRIIGSDTELAQTRSMLASAHHDYAWDLKEVSQLPHALRECLKAIQIRLDLGEESELAGSLNNCGLIYHDLNKFDSAIGQFKRSLRIRRKLKNPLLVAKVLNNMGLSLMSRYPDEAVKAFEESVALRREHKSDRLEVTLSNLIRALGATGRRSEIDPYQQEVDRLRYNRESS